MAMQNVVSQAYAISSPWVNPPGNAFDGGLITNWATAQVSSEGISGAAWIGQNFPVPKTIVQVTIEQLSPQTAIDSVKLQRSDDGSSWTDVGTYAIGKDTTKSTVDFTSAGSHTHWRLLANANPGGTERWQVTEVTMSEEASAANVPSPKFQAYRSVDYAVTPGGFFVVPFDARWYDTNDDYDPATYRFQPGVAGYYSFQAYIMLKGTITGKVHVEVTKNADGAGGFVKPWWPGAEGLFGYVIDIPMNGTTDFVDVRVNVESGSNVVIDGERSWFVGHYIGT